MIPTPVNAHHVVALVRLQKAKQLVGIDSASRALDLWPVFQRHRTDDLFQAAELAAAVGTKLYDTDNEKGEPKLIFGEE